MMIRLFLLGFSAMSLLTAPLLSHGARLYRYLDENGVPTLSLTLPPEAAQQGYDVLDDKTMRLIEQVPPAPTAEQIAEQQEQKAREAEAQRQADIAAREAEQENRRQASYDRSLLTTYRDENELMRARDDVLQHRRSQMEARRLKLERLEQQRVALQREAGQMELSGGTVSANLQARLDATGEDILQQQAVIAQLRSEIEDLSEKYDSDLARLRQLLGRQGP